MMSAIGSRENLLRHIALVALVALVGVGCGTNPAESEEAVETVRSPLTFVVVDDSASPVHIRITACGTDVTQSQQTINCTVDSGYALIGGGATAQVLASPTGRGGTMGGGGSGGTGGGGGTGGILGVPLKSSRPLDGRTWQASAGHSLISAPIYLEAYAVGLRLDGVNAATLRGMITRSSFTTSPPQSIPGVTLVNPNTMTTIAGGARANTSGAGQYLVRSSPNAMDGWTVRSRDHITSSPGTITAVTTRLMTKGIIEGFGKLEAAGRTGMTSTVTSGEAVASDTVTTGWAIAGYGGWATTTSGPGRLLTALSFGDGGARFVKVGSRDVGQPSAGSTTVNWSEVRRVPNSHGLCTEGGPLATSMDSCVATICTPGNDPYCCNNFWDSTCVSEVTSMCGKSCADYSCSTPSFTPAFWNDGGSVQFNNNSYNYANNRRTDTIAEPGRASGEFCSALSCTTATTLATYAVADGLIDGGPAGACPDGRNVIALYVAPNFDYIWYRLDSSGWTYKRGALPATNLDFSGNPITNPSQADRGIYTTFGGYFCTCSSSVEGGGHAVIQ